MPTPTETSRFFQAPQHNKKSNVLMVLLAADGDAGVPDIDFFSSSQKLKFIDGLLASPLYPRNNALVAMVRSGNILDLTSPEALKMLIFPEDHAKKRNILENIARRKSMVPLVPGKTVFTNILILGGLFQYTKEAADALYMLIQTCLHPEGRVRFQICNFMTRRIEDSHDIFYQSVCRSISPLQCSIPEGYSVISDKTARAIDIHLTREEFSENVLSIKNIIDRREFNEVMIYQEICTLLRKKNITHDFQDIFLVDEKGDRVDLAKLEVIPDDTFNKTL